jgi:nucleotide-binding universal stress UspA family protein
MSYATIMVHVDVDAELARRVSIAADLADCFRAHLIGTAAWAPTFIFPSREALIDPHPRETRLQDMKTLLDQKGKQFCSAVGTSERHVEWRSVLDSPTEAVAREARAADLVIIGNARENMDPLRALDPNSFLLKVGRPVLVVPPAVVSLSLKRVAIAWKDTREARRAVRDALPLLQKADSVMIVEMPEPGDEGDQDLHRVKDVAKYLGRHRIEIVTERVRPADVTAANSLLRLIQEENINLVVAGAWGHSRLGEWAYGGMTHDLMAESTICCLFSH